jgi:nucleoside-diphosphate-sugar epimerase
MKVLVTGANGFVGRAVCRCLTERGHGPLAVVRRATGLSGEIVIANAIGEADWPAVLTDCEAVVHLAARAHVMREESPDPLQVFRAVNTGGTLRLAQQAAACGVRRFVFVSSIGVTGNATQGHAFTENDVPAPHDAYAVSKLEAEQSLQAVAGAMEWVIVRPPLVYGPGAPGNFARLLKLARTGLPLPLGAVRNRRSFIALDNLADFIVTCCEHPAAANQTFLVADGEDVSTTELLRRIAAACGKKAHLLPVPVSWLRWAARALGHPAVAQRLLDSLVVDSSKARRLLSWSPPITMDEQLERLSRCDART